MNVSIKCMCVCIKALDVDKDKIVISHTKCEEWYLAKKSI